MNRLIISIFLLVLSVGFLACEEDKKQNENETAEVNQTQQKLSDAQVKDAISDHIQEKFDYNGKFSIEDKIENRVRNLSFGYIHKSVKKDEKGRYFACVDFTDGQKDTLDLDFYVSVNSYGVPKVSKVIIHKVNGKSR